MNIEELIRKHPDSKPTSDSFKNYHKIPGVIKAIWEILKENNSVVISKLNQKRIRELIKTLE